MSHEDHDEKTPSTPVTQAVSNEVEAPARPRFEDLPPAAQRALTEAEARRRARAADEAAARPKEIAGRDGPEPVRYGDWERKGLICDF